MSYSDETLSHYGITKTAAPQEGMFEVLNTMVKYWYSPVDIVLSQEKVINGFKNFEYFATGQRGFPIKLKIFNKPELISRNNRPCFTGTVTFDPKDIERVLGKELTKVEYKTWLKDELLKSRAWNEGSIVR